MPIDRLSTVTVTHPSQRDLVMAERQILADLLG
jgi:hypothetical protein